MGGRSASRSYQEGTVDPPAACNEDIRPYSWEWDIEISIDDYQK